MKRYEIDKSNDLKLEEDCSTDEASFQEDELTSSADEASTICDMLPNIRRSLHLSDDEEEKQDDDESQRTFSAPISPVRKRAAEIAGELINSWLAPTLAQTKLTSPSSRTKWILDSSRPSTASKGSTNTNRSRIPRNIRLPRPQRIILLRHGESEAMLNAEIRCDMPDHRISLSSKGRRQAVEAGRELDSIINGESVHFYVSPYLRARQTFECMVSDAFQSNKYRVCEEIRLRELDFGNFIDIENYERILRERERFGHFFYRFNNGESGSDVYNRVSSFINDLHRDFVSYEPCQNVIIISHGLTMRIFLMRWFHWTVEEFESLENFNPCEYAMLEACPHGYEMKTALHRWKTDVYRYRTRNVSQEILSGDYYE